MGVTEGLVFKGRGREILFGMKGWRPSACPIGPKTGSGLVKRAYSCRTSDRSACLFRGSSVPGLMTRGLVLDAGFLFALIRLCGRQVGPKPRPSVRDDEKAPALPHLPEEPKTKIEGPTMNPGANMPTLPRYLKPESASTRKNASGGGRKSLKRLELAKESKDFNLDFVPPDLEFVPSGLDFLPKNLDFLQPAGGAGLPVLAQATRR